MRTIYPVIVISALLVLFLLGVVCFLGAVHLFPLGWVLGFFAQAAGFDPEGSGSPSLAASFAFAILGAIFMATAGLATASFWMTPNERGSILLPGLLGRISIPISRIEESLRRAAVRVEAVDHADVKVIQSGAGVGAEISVTLSLNRPIPLVSADVQTSAREELASILGHEHVRTIEVRVAEYRRKPGSREEGTHS